MSANPTRIAAIFVAIFLLPVCAAPNFITGPTASPIYTDNATITWQTDSESTCALSYGTTEALGTYAENATNSSFHSILLTQLAPSTTYFFNVTSCDGENCTTVGPNTFASLAHIYQPAPLINGSSIAANSTNDSAAISWETNINSNSRVLYGTSANYGSEKVLEDNVTLHSLTLLQLNAATIYQYLVQSCNAGNCTNSSNSQFTTLSNPAVPSPSASPTPSPTPTAQQNAPYLGTCYDTDGGKEYYTKGEVIAGYEGGEDACETESILKEYMCNPEKTQAGTIRYSCPYGCTEGKCKTKIESEKVGSPSAAPSPKTLERKVGFRTRLKAESFDNRSEIAYTQELEPGFSGEMRTVLPFEFAQYNLGKLAISPKPLLARNDGSGQLEVLFEIENTESGIFTFSIYTQMPVDEALMGKFSVPIITGTGNPTPSKKESALEEAAKLINATNATDFEAKPVTGLVAASQRNDDSGWMTALFQLVLLFIGIGAIHYFEGDLKELNTEQTSSILEDLEGDPRLKK